MDGKIVSLSQKRIEALTPGILKGKGVFETMRAYDGRIFALKEHLRRLYKGGASLKMKFPYAPEEIRRHLESTLQSNQLKNARIRLTVWRSGTRMHTAIIVWPLMSLRKSEVSRGMKAMAVFLKEKFKLERPRIKSIRYQVFLKAYQEAKKKGYDEAVFLNGNNEIIEGSRSNVFIVRDKMLSTPSLRYGCLNGITRGYVLTIARRMGFSAKTSRITLDELTKADEAFVTNSVWEIMPLTRVNHQRIGPGGVGFVTRKLLREYKRLVN